MSILSRNPPDFETSDRMDRDNDADIKARQLMAQPRCLRCDCPMETEHALCIDCVEETREEPQDPPETFGTEEGDE